MEYIWNPWHGCHKVSAGCINCYVYRRDLSVGRDPTIVYQTKSFSLPVQLKRNGQPIMTSGADVYTCLTSDFFLEEADGWRKEVWRMIRQRGDLFFIIITKRIHRAQECLPKDWGEGYPNVMIGCTVENQLQADKRLPIFLELPCRRKFIVCEPLLEEMDLTDYLDPAFEYLICGGESGPQARECNYDWVLSLRRQCLDAYVPFHFKQTGANFIKDGRAFRIPRRKQKEQAKKANIDT